MLELLDDERLLRPDDFRDVLLPPRRLDDLRDVLRPRAPDDFFAVLRVRVELPDVFRAVLRPRLDPLERDAPEREPELFFFDVLDDLRAAILV